MYEVSESCVTSFFFFFLYLACSQCSASCGDGVQRRQVLCRAGERRTSPESGCSARSRPPSSRSCRLADCPSRYRWREGDWQAVSPGSPGSSESFLDKEGGGSINPQPPSTPVAPSGRGWIWLCHIWWSMSRCSSVRPEGRRGAAAEWPLMEIRWSGGRPSHFF